MTPTPDPNALVAWFRVAFSLAWRLSPGSDLVLMCTWLLLDQVTFPCLGTCLGLLVTLEASQSEKVEVTS